MGRKAVKAADKRTLYVTSTFPAHYDPLLDWLAMNEKITRSELFQYLIDNTIKTKSPFSVKIGFYDDLIDHYQEMITQAKIKREKAVKEADEYNAKITQYATIEQKNRDLPEADQYNPDEMIADHVRRIAAQYPFIDPLTIRADLKKAAQQTITRADVEKELKRIGL